MEIQDRIKVLIDSLKESQASFSKNIGVQTSVINHIVTGNSHNEGKRNKPSFDLLQKILVKYPNVNLKWLLLGEGEIFNSFDISESRKYADDVIHKLMKEIKEMKDLILEKDKKEMIYVETINNLSKH